MNRKPVELMFKVELQSETLKNREVIQDLMKKNENLNAQRDKAISFLSQGLFSIIMNWKKIKQFLKDL